MLDFPVPLLDAVRARRASLFLGAGASAEADFPTPPALAEYLAKEAGEPHTGALRSRPLDHVAQYLYKEHGFGKHWVRQKLIDLFRALHQRVGRPPSKGHEIMTQVSWRAIFTTNFDRLVEISYDFGQEAVQSVLPIYEPDPQIQYHDAHTVRLIKLNGSVDEAARSTKHELVLTFSEQQEARERNDSFYRLLRDEAVNGPFLFIGFGFTHPGASLPGTSPEFLELQRLLREMGGTARYHYCVVPDESALASDKLVRSILEDAKVHVITGRFSAFMAALQEKLGKRAIALGKRPPVRVPLGPVALEIPADEYDDDIRHFELLNQSFADIPAPEVAKSLDGEANWGSFREKHYIRRACEAALNSTLHECLEKAPAILVLSAPLGWGKTFLLRALAIQRLQSGSPTIWLNPLSTLEVQSGDGESIVLGSWDSQRIDAIIGRIVQVSTEASVSREIATPLLIADECAERVPELLSLFRSLEANNRDFVLLISLTEVELEVLKSEHPLLRTECVVQPADIPGSEDEVRRLVRLCIENQAGAVKPSTNEAILSQHIIEEGAGKLLVLALQIIYDGEHRPFEEIVRMLWEKSGGELAQRFMLRIALLHQYGSLFCPRLFPILRSFGSGQMSAVLETYKGFLEERILYEQVVQEEPCVSLMHPLVSQKLVIVSDLDPKDLDKELLAVTSRMTGTIVDLELLRRFLKRANDYGVTLSSEESETELFEQAAKATNFDWVICQQYTKFLLRREQPKLAHTWAKRALEKNPRHASLHHTLGNVLRKWGMDLLSQGRSDEAQKRFDGARDAFANSRVGREPDEYGYVTHLDMLISLSDREESPAKKASLIAEGISLYQEGLRAVPEHRYNWLLFGRYRKHFDVSEKEIRLVVDRLRALLEEGRAPLAGVLFLAEYFAGYALYDDATDVLAKYLEGETRAPPIAWIKRAEIFARGGSFRDGARAIDTAKSHISETTNWEHLWSLWYWDLLISIARSDFREARAAIGELRSGGYFARPRYPRGYVWLEKARNTPREERNFLEHAKIYSGRISNLRVGGATGLIRLTNPAGDFFEVEFVRRYFSRGDFRRGNSMRFAMELLPNGVRAADINSKPFEKTSDDLFVA